MFLYLVSCGLRHLPLVLVVVKDGRHVLAIVFCCWVVPFPETVEQGFIICLSRIELNVYRFSVVTTVNTWEKTLAVKGHDCVSLIPYSKHMKHMCIWGSKRSCI